MPFLKCCLCFKLSLYMHGSWQGSSPTMEHAFIRPPEDYFDASTTFKQSHAPQSGEIFGILQQMKEPFETNLSDSQKEEMASQKAWHP